MVFARSFFVLGFLGLVTACAPQALQPAEIGANVAVTAPAAEVSADHAAFSGIWAGTWGARLDGKLAVQTIDADGTITGVYAWGDHPKGKFKAGSIPVDGMIDGGVLRLKPFENGANVTYTMQSDGTLEGAYDLGGAVSKGIFSKG